MAISPEDAMTWLYRIERRQHDQGWDSLPPTVCVIHATRPEPSVTVLPSTMPDARHYMMALATTLLTGLDVGLTNHSGGVRRESSLHKEVIRPTTALVAFVAECWEPPVPQSQWPPYARGAADVPGAREVRVAYGIDLRGNCYGLARYRGEDPRPLTDIDLTDPEIITMIYLAYAIASQMPASADADAENLAQMSYVIARLLQTGAS